MDKKTKSKFGSAFDKFLDDPDFKKDYDKEFKEFALSELLVTLMDDEKQSVRKLAELAGISPTTIQNIKSGKNSDIKLRNFINIVEACGYRLEIVKGETSWGLSA